MPSVAELTQFARLPADYVAAQRSWRLKLLWELAVQVADGDLTIAEADAFKPWTDDERGELRQMVVLARNPRLRDQLGWAVPFNEALEAVLAEVNTIRRAA